MTFASTCKDSLATYKIVVSCPHNFKEWNEAAQRKGCNKMTNQCSSFEYHCVISPSENKLIKVCAPRLMIVGKNGITYYYTHAY